MTVARHVGWWGAMVAAQFIVWWAIGLRSPGPGDPAWLSGLLLPLPTLAIAALRELLREAVDAHEISLVPQWFVRTEYTHAGLVMEVPAAYAGWVRQGRAWTATARACLSTLVALLIPWTIAFVVYNISLPPPGIADLGFRVAAAAVGGVFLGVFYAALIALWTPAVALMFGWRAGVARARVEVDGRRVITEAGTIPLRREHQVVAIHRGALVLKNPHGALIVYGARSVLVPLRDALLAGSTALGRADEVPDALSSIRTATIEPALEDPA